MSKNNKVLIIITILVCIILTSICGIIIGITETGNTNVNDNNLNTDGDNVGEDDELSTYLSYIDIENDKKEFLNKIKNAYNNYDKENSGIENNKFYYIDRNNNNVKTFIDDVEGTPKKIICSYFEGSYIECLMLTQSGNERSVYLMESDKELTKIKTNTKTTKDIGLFDIPWYCDYANGYILKDSNNQEYIINGNSIITLSEFLGEYKFSYECHGFGNVLTFDYNNLNVYNNTKDNIKLLNNTNDIAAKKIIVKHNYKFGESLETFYLIDKNNNLYIITNEDLKNNISNFSSHGKVKDIDLMLGDYNNYTKIEIKLENKTITLDTVDK